MQNIKDQTIVVEKGIGRPKNPKGDEPYVRECICSDCLQDNERDADEHAEFEQYAKDNSFSTEAPDGTYKASEFGQEEWEIQHTAGWSTLDKFEVPIYVGTNATVRRFRPLLTPHPMNNEQTTAPDERGGEKLNVGDKLYLIPAEKRDNPFQAEVKSIGRKYFEIVGIGIKFHIDTLQPKEQTIGHSMPYKVYKSKLEYDCLQESRRLKDLLISKIQALNRETVEKLLSIINS